MKLGKILGIICIVALLVGSSSAAEIKQKSQDKYDYVDQFQQGVAASKHIGTNGDGKEEYIVHFDFPSQNNDGDYVVTKHQYNKVDFGGVYDYIYAINNGHAKIELTKI